MTTDQGADAAAMRRCLVSGDSLPKGALVRFVVAPGGEVVPDVKGSLPGRGLWLRARRDIVGTACARKHFARAARRPVVTPDQLADRVEALLARRCLEFIGLARRAGEAVCGFEKVRGWLRAGRNGVLVAAGDGAADGRAKLRTLAPDLPLVDILTAAELGGAFGRPQVVHGLLAPGGLAERLLGEAARLEGFRRAEGSGAA